MEMVRAPKWIRCPFFVMENKTANLLFWMKGGKMVNEDITLLFPFYILGNDPHSI